MTLNKTTIQNQNGEIYYLLHKHPSKIQSFDLSFGKAYVIKFMKTIIFITLFITLYGSVHSQINPEDSTVNIISFWEKGDKLQYKVTFETVKLTGKDTTAHERSVSYYDVMVTKETKKSYTLKWLCTSCNIKTESQILRRLSKGCKDMKIVYETDEMGEFKKFLNMKEIKKQMEKSYKDVKKDLGSIAKMKEQIEQLEKIALTESAIEEKGLAFIHLFHSFHGRQFKLKELLQRDLKEPNSLGGEDFDSKFSLSLDSINFTEEFSILKMKQVVDEEQLRKETLNYLINMSKSMEIEPPTGEDVKNLTWLLEAKFIIYNDGWIKEVEQIKTAADDKTKRIETMKVELE